MRQSKRRHGYTLLELMITLPLLAILLAGMAAAVGLAARAMPEANTHTSAPLSAAAACDQLAAELGYATAITSRSATSIQFTCPDRNGDNIAESIQYTWTGAGTGLNRSLNGGAAQALLPGVQQLSLTYYTRTAGSVSYLQSVEVSLTAPTSTARPLAVRFPCFNEPQLP